MTTDLGDLEDERLIPEAQVLRGHEARQEAVMFGRTLVGWVSD